MAYVVQCSHNALYFRRAPHLRIRQNDLERVEDLMFLHPAAKIEEVGGFSAAVLDDVHRGHRQACAVHCERKLLLTLI